MNRILLLLATVIFTSTVSAAPEVETPKERNARMQWWRDAKFGMFIHWGVYAVPAGTYHGKQISGIGEWIMRNAEIPVAEYRAFAWQFNPVKYDPAAWAKLAREAGMKYIVITAKHHDGFALYPSDVTDWDVMDSTPYQKDLLGPLAKAARRNGLKFGTYYSQAQDWNHPGGAKARLKEGEAWDERQKGSFDDYLKNIAAPQVREILTRIKPDVLWWDTPTWMNADRAKPLHDLIALRPGLITNNRLGGGYRGDTETPEQHIPATGFKDRDWETCMTMNDTWGFKSYDQNWKSTETLIRNLVDIVSKGGNYLLNVGPTAEGEIPAASIQRLKEIGAWMNVNGAAIYGTTASPFARLNWGRCTKKVSAKGGTLYLHVFDWPNDGKLVLPGLRSTVTGARMLSTGARVGARSDGAGVVLAVPANAPDRIASVIEVKFTGPLTVERVLPGQQSDGTIVLMAQDADIHNSLRAHAQLEGRGEAAKVAKWNDAEARVSWDFRAARPGNYLLEADIAGSGGGKLAIVMDQATVPAEVVADQSAARRTIELGNVVVPKPGDLTIELRPERQSWKGFDLHRLVLVPKQP